MKKILIASTALVAAGFITAGSASASEKIKLNLGGYSKWWVVGQFNDNGAQERTQTNPANVDVKGDNEIYFGGKTKLDNGIEVGIDVQLEAGGHTDANGTDTIDESYIWLAGNFGKFIVGSKNNGTYLLHVTAPDAAGNWNEGGIMTGGFSIVANQVTGMAGGNTTAILTDGDSEKITYVAPTFYGLTVGGSYIPSALSEDNRGATGNTNVTVNGVATPTAVRSDVPAYGVGALYAETFGGVGVKASAGWVTYDVGGASTQNNEHAYGLNLSYAGFTLGGSYRVSNFNDPANATVTGIGTQTANLFSQKGHAYDAGLSYASGPYAVSFAYFHSKVNGNDTAVATGTAAEGKDEMSFYQVSGKYNLGAGVDLLASIGYADLDNGDQIDASGVGEETDNSGWVAMTGLSLQF